MHTKHSRGFTLIELMVVISIIGLLSSVMLSALQTARQRSEDTKHIQALGQLKRAMELYYDQNGAYPDLPAINAWQQNCWDCTPTFIIARDNGRLAALEPYLPDRPSGRSGAGFSGYVYKVSADHQEYLIILMNTIQNTSNIPATMRNTTYLAGNTGAAIYSSETPRSWGWWTNP